MNVDNFTKNSFFLLHIKDIANCNSKRVLVYVNQNFQMQSIKRKKIVNKKGKIWSEGA